MELTLNETWLHGKYDNGEINTALSYVAVNDPDFFAQAYAESINAEVNNVNIPASIHNYGHQLGQRAKTYADAFRHRRTR